ncbi:UNVERIFIED_CONTAM: putative arginine--tRNA ligase, cytoplasmic, partial [Eudyptes robustus]
EYVSNLPGQVLPLEHEREFKLAKQLLKFSDTLLLVLESLQLHKLCDYVYNLATVFHDFYKDCYVINKSKTGEVTIHYHRLVLCEVTADTMAACFKILGIRPIERM